MGRKADGANLILGNWERRGNADGLTGLIGGEHSCPSSELLAVGEAWTCLVSPHVSLHGASQGTPLGASGEML